MWRWKNPWQIARAYFWLVVNMLTIIVFIIWWNVYVGGNYSGFFKPEWAWVSVVWLTTGAFLLVVLYLFFRRRHRFQLTVSIDLHHVSTNVCSFSCWLSLMYSNVLHRLLYKALAGSITLRCNALGVSVLGFFRFIDHAIAFFVAHWRDTISIIHRI